MGRVLGLIIAVMTATAALGDIAQPRLDDLKWVSRALVVFVDNPADPRLEQQLGTLDARREELEARDVVILVDTDPETLSPLRLKLRPRGFMLVLIDKDGAIIYRRPDPVPARELLHLIDRTPLRLQETGH